jgi:hypothetical protein
MNEEAIKDAYNLFVQNGYNKSIDDFKKLIASNPEALNDSYNLFKDNGYNKSVEDYKALMGLTAQPVTDKKKVATVLPSAGTSSDLSANERLAVGPMGIVGLERGKPLPKPTEEDEGQGWLMNTVSSLDRGFYKNLIGNPIKGLGTLLEQGTAKLIGGSGKAPISDALINFGEYFNNAIDELAPQDEEFKGSLSDQFGQAFGQVAGLILTRGATAAFAKAPTAAQAATAALATQAAPTTMAAVKTLASELASPTAVSAGLSMGQNEFERAKAAGATDDQAFEAFYKNAAVGSVLEKIPVMQFMKRFNQASAGGIANYIKTKGVAGLTGGFEEMTTEVLQQLYANKTAQDIYNTNQNLFEGVGESGGVGFGVGFLLNAMGANARLLRQQGKPKEADMVEAQIAQFEQQAERGGPSSYTFNGVNIQDFDAGGGVIVPSRDIVSNMIDNMTANDLVKANIEITNDPELNNKLQNKIVTSSIKEQAREANPNLSEEALDEITNLEKELRKLEGNTTQLGKDKAAEIRAQIREVQKGVQTEEAVPSWVADLEDDASLTFTVQTLEEVPEEFRDKATQMDGTQYPINKKILGLPIGESEALGVGPRYVYKLTGKEIKDYAIQKQGFKASQQAETTLEQELRAALPYEFYENQLNAEYEWQRNQAKEFLADPKAYFESSIQEATATLERDPNNKIAQSVLDTNTERLRIFNEITNKYKQDAIQKQTAGQVPIQPTTGDSQTMEEGKPQAELESVTSEGQAQEEVVSSKTRVNIAPFFNTKVETVEQAEQLRQAPEYQAYKEVLGKLAEQLGIQGISIDDIIGGYKSDAGDEIVEISNQITFDNATIEQAEEFAAMIAALAPEVQEASIASQYVPQGAENHNANEYRFKVSDVNGAIKALKGAGITDFSINEKDGTVIFTDVLDFADAQLQNKIGKFAELLDENNISYEQQQFRPTESRYVDKGKRKEVIRRIKGDGARPESRGQGFSEAVEQAIQRDAEFQGTTYEEYTTGKEPKKPAAGNRLFNEPLEAVKEIADRYYQRAFGTKRPDFKGTRKLDKERAKRISDAFIAMKHAPNDPAVRDAYNAMAKETIEQYKDFLAAGYVVEINNQEPYANSQEMIDDLRNNKRIKIFSTESGFGDDPITEQQREENPLLNTTEFTDVNGQPMLVNDLFRAVHDFFGHAELGNSFGPLGEENAWNVHARMFSPLARKAMTTETRGQNSFVNFSGVNEEADRIREEARKLREEGKFEEALKITDEIYQNTSFADQKVGLLPDEFSEIDDENIMTADTKNPTVLEKVRDFLDKAEADLDKFGRETAGINIAVPVMKAIIKGIKALVNTGITLQEAIRRVAAENNVTEKDVTDTLDFLAQQRELQGKPQEVTEMELPGYNRMMGELEGVIEKSRQRGVEEDKVMENAMAYLQGSRVYESASDTQREKMVRDLRKMFGKREKAAPKPEKLFGEAKDVNMITMSEYDLLTKRIKDMAKGAKDAKAIWTRTSNELTKYLKSMVDGGYLSAKQTAAVLRKFSGVNMFDENSIGRFVDYMQKVFGNAAYAEQIDSIRSMLPTAKKNAQTKIGVAQTLSPLMKQLLAVDPTLIPDSVFDKYVEIVTMMGERKAVLNLQESGKVTQTVEDILDAINEEVSRSEELSELFDSYADKVIDEDGKLDFAATIRQMVKEEVITEEEATIMRKYKKNIVPKAERVEKTEEELAAEKEVLVGAVKDMEVDSDGLSMKDERNKARELAKLIKSNAVEGLDATQLNNLMRVIDNINNGYFPHFAQLMIERLNAINNAKTLDNSVVNAKPLPLSTIYAKLKSLVTDKDKFLELIRRNPLYYIDQVFGNFKTKDIYNSLFEKPAEAQSMFQRSVNEINNKLDKAEQAVAKSFKQDANKTLMSKFKMMTFMIQLENESNPDSNQVNPAAEYLKKTIDHIRNGKSSFGERDAKMLEEILNEYSDENGNIDNEKLYKSFNAAEKNAIKTIQEINESIRDKAIYTAAVIRGDKIHPLNNYIHLNVLHEFRPDEAVSGVAFIDSYNNSLQPSTKAKSLIARTGKVAPLNFDVFASANRGAKFTLMDYYLTEPIRTGRKTINETSDLMKKEKATKEQRDIFNAIDRAFEESVDNLLTSNFTISSIGDKAVEFMSKQGYRAVLASLPRFVGELSSNIAFSMIATPKEFKLGVANRDVVLSADASTIMNNVGSKQTNRLFPNDTLSGRLVDTSILEQASGVRGGRAKNDVANKIQQIYNLSLKKYQNSVELMADALISTPDKMVMRPIWFGSFATEFKRLTGNDVDFDKIAKNDEKYMAANKEAIDESRNTADQKSVLAGATDNAFMGILKGTPKPNQSAMLRGFNLFNSFMTRFLIYEYVTARTGIMAAMGNGSISQRQGVALLGAVATRMTLYTLLTNILGEAMVGLFVDDDDADDEKTLLQKIGQAMASSATSMLIGRDFGNATKGLLNEGVEYMNENYLDFLRKGDYDPYKDAIQYTIMPPERKGKKAAFGDMLMNMMGPFGPSIKTLELAIRKATEPEKKETAAQQRVEKEKQIRIPLEVLGNLGMIPLYKDVRKIVNKELYKELDNAEEKKPMNKLNKEDMKRYFPEMYNKIYGPGGSMYNIEQMKNKIKRDKEKLKRQMKDEMYNYTPK